MRLFYIGNMLKVFGKTYDSAENGSFFQKAKRDKVFFLSVRLCHFTQNIPKMTMDDVQFYYSHLDPFSIEFNRNGKEL